MHFTSHVWHLWTSLLKERSSSFSVNSNLHFEQKQGQRIAVNCLLEGRDVFAVMPTGFGKSFIFQLFSTAIEEKKISEGKHPNSVILVICPLLSVKWG